MIWQHSFYDQFLSSKAYTATLADTTKHIKDTKKKKKTEADRIVVA